MRRLKKKGNSVEFQHLLDLLKNYESKIPWVISKNNPSNTYVELINKNTQEVKSFTTFNDLQQFVKSLNIQNVAPNFLDDEFTTIKMLQGMSKAQLFDVLVYGKDIVINNIKYKPRFEVVGGPFKGQKMTIYDLWDKNIRWVRVMNPDGTFYDNVELQNRPQRQNPDHQKMQDDQPYAQQIQQVQQQTQQIQQQVNQVPQTNSHKDDYILPSRKERIDKERQEKEQFEKEYKQKQPGLWQKMQDFVKRLSPKDKTKETKETKETKDPHPLSNISESQILTQFSNEIARVYSIYSNAKRANDQNVMDTTWGALENAVQVITGGGFASRGMSLSEFRRRTGLPFGVGPSISAQQILNSLTENAKFPQPTQFTFWSEIDNALKKLRQVSPAVAPSNQQLGPLQTLFTRVRKSNDGNNIGRLLKKSEVVFEGSDSILQELEDLMNSKSADIAAIIAKVKVADSEPKRALIIKRELVPVLNDFNQIWQKLVNIYVDKENALSRRYNPNKVATLSKFFNEVVPPILKIGQLPDELRAMLAHPDWWDTKRTVSKQSLNQMLDSWKSVLLAITTI